MLANEVCAVHYLTMSRTLPSGIWSKTGYLPTQEQTRKDGELEYWHYAEIGDSPKVAMEEAVDLLRQAFDDPVLFADPRFEEFRKYIKSFYPVQRFDEDGFSTSTRLEPAIQRFPLDVEELEHNPGPTREVLGNQLTLYDIIGFTHYLLINTTTEGPDDPRIAWLEELRGNQEPPGK
jgi:hypothetical protein